MRKHHCEQWLVGAADKIETYLALPGIKKRKLETSGRNNLEESTGRFKANKY